MTKRANKPTTNPNTDAAAIATLEAENARLKSELALLRSLLIPALRATLAALGA